MTANTMSRWTRSLRIAALIFSLDAAFTVAQGIDDTTATNITSPPTVSNSTPLGVRQTILCIVPTGDQWVASFADICTLGLEGLGISYEVLTFPQAGTPLPTLEQDGYGNYGGIVTLKELSYEYSEPGRTGWLSALSDAQWTALYDYQVKYGVRMARLDAFPTTQFGANVRAPGGSSAAGQLWSFTNLTGFESSGIKEGGTVAMDGLYYYGADVTDAATTYPIAKLHSGPTFTSDATAAVINAFPHTNGTREQMVFFTSFAAGWSQASNFIQHSWISWMTRGLYLGQRRAYLGTHIDDVLLTTTICKYTITPATVPCPFTFKHSPALPRSRSWSFRAKD